MKEIIEKYHIKAKKSLGQNFLMDEKILQEIWDITSIEGNNILEVWPWFGALTQKILQKKPLSLTLVELDTFMIEILQDRIQNNDLDITQTNFEIINNDVLKIEPNFETYKVIANIPYYITSPILYKFLYEAQKKPTQMIILMQKEVGDRIVSKKSSVLSLFVQKKCTVSQKIFVPKQCFSPAPKIDSTVLFFELHNLYSQVDDAKFMAFIKAAFSNPRKKMINNLAQWGYSKEQNYAKLLQLGFNDNTRAEELSIADYIYLLTD